MNNQTATLFFLLILMALLWMDTCLYFQIQNTQPSMQDSDVVASNFSATTLGLSKIQAANTSSSSNGNNNFGVKTTKMANMFSFAFHGLSIKLMMTDPLDNYIFAPLAEGFIEWTQFNRFFYFISPNMISYAGVVSAIIGAKLVSYDNPTMHKLSILLFQLRTFLDALDGLVARSRLHIHKHLSLQHTSGYVIDGVCDGIGFVAYVIGCYIFLKRRYGNSYRSHQLDPTFSAVNRGGSNLTDSKRQSIQYTNNYSSYIPLTVYDEEDQQHQLTNDLLDDELLENDSANNNNNNNNNSNNNNSPYSHTRKQHDLSKQIHDDDDDDNNNNDRVIDLEERQETKRRNKKFNYLQIRHNNYLPSRFSIAKKLKNGSLLSIDKWYIPTGLKRRTTRRIFLVLVCFLLQIAICSIFWNRYIIFYRQLLESNSATPKVASVKNTMLRSNLMWIIIWFWRFTNGHSMMHMLTIAIFFGKLWKFIDFVKYIGFLEIFLLAGITELHAHDTQAFLAVISD